MVSRLGEAIVDIKVRSIEAFNYYHCSTQTLSLPTLATFFVVHFFVRWSVYRSPHQAQKRWLLKSRAMTLLSQTLMVREREL